MKQTARQRAREIVSKHGGVCLVPNSGLGGITSHEKTFCDCTVEDLITEALEEVSVPEYIKAMQEVIKAADELAAFPILKGQLNRYAEARARLDDVLKEI